jgi:hypothetical protein
MEPKFVVGYLQACVTGELSFFECAPILEVGITAALLIVAVVLLVVVRIRSQPDGQREAEAGQVSAPKELVNMRSA